MFYYFEYFAQLKYSNMKKYIVLRKLFFIHDEFE